MTDRELDQIIKRLLENYQPETDLSGWEQFEQRLDQEMLEDTLFDNSVRASLGAFVPDQGADWARMERALDAEETVFDGSVKEKVEQYEVPYDPQSWPIMKARINDDERLRRRIIVTKVLELTAILIAFITVYNFFPAIQSAVIQPTEKFVKEKLRSNNQAQATNDQTLELLPVEQGLASLETTDETSETSQDGTDIQTDQGLASDSNAQPVPTTGDAVTTQQNASVVTENNAIPENSVTEGSMTEADLGAADLAETTIDHAINTSPGVTNLVEGSITPAAPSINDLAHVPTFRTLASLDSEVTTARRTVNPDIPAIVVATKKGLRFSISTSTELNQLYIPADHFYSLGKQVSFTEKDMTAVGYSAGASVLFDREVFTFETGIHYSSKTYHPNRILHIGETFDVRTLDFKNISLSVISVPLQMHWNFDRKGKTRLYTVGGVSMNLIAEAHYDLITTNGFRSSAAPADPSFQRTSQEVQRIREHILDDAEFSAKSFLTVNAGFGVEHLINHKFSVFVQPTASYQIPFFHISDQNGKHLQYLSMQFGTRVRLR